MEIKYFSQKHKKMFVYFIAIGITVIVAIVALCWSIVASSGVYILDANKPDLISSKNVRVGLVLGAGISKNGKPYKELEARLDIAADAISKGQVKKLILSGDNRFENYNEPKAMRDYLVKSKRIDPKLLQEDYAGRSTYESCERANKVFGQKQLIIFSAKSHLPRAIYLCRKFGIESYGISSNVEANNSSRREVMARVKAIYNIYLMGEKTVLGMSSKI